MRPSMICVIGLVLMSLLTSGLVFAKAPDQATLDKAETHFFDGVKHYRANRFDDAAMSFQRAFTLTKDRTLLFNVARCQERTGDVDAAVAWYQSYLLTKPADETGVIHRIKQLGVKDVRLASDRTERRQVVRRGAALEKLQPIGYRWMKWGLLGGGVASVAVGISLGVQSMDESEKSKDASGTIAADQWSRQAERNAFAADIFVVAGALALGTAGYFFISEALGEDDAVGVFPDAGGASFVYRGSF